LLSPLLFQRELKQSIIVSLGPPCSTMNRISWLPRRAKQVFQTEGFISLVRRGFAFVAFRFFRYQTYYLYETDLQGTFRERTEAYVLPRIQNFTFKVVSTKQQADELEAEGLEFRSHAVNANDRLDKGAVAFCVFSERDLASIGWVAMTQEVKDSLAQRPFRVDFPNGEACGGNSWTNPKYRGMGLMAYSLFKRLEFLRESGKIRYRATGHKRTIASRKAATKVGCEIYAEARYLKILWWKSWKETPLA